MEKDGTEKVVHGKEGQDLLHLAHENDVDLEGTLARVNWFLTLGACEASLACSTCHVILEQDVFDKLPEASIEEEDMLDLAFGLTRT